MDDAGPVQRVPWFDLFMSFLLVAFLVGGLFSGYLFYQTVRHVVAHNQLPPLPHLGGVAPGPPSSSQGTQPLGATEPGSPNTGGASAPLEYRQERVNVLLMGIDKREGEVGPWRTDTMILLTIDPRQRTAGMVSIPRDLYVTIPDFGIGPIQSRINTAFFYGDLRRYPGGGPALAKETIRRNFGIPVQYYVLIDFEGFQKLIDLVGGIVIDVPKEILDTNYPDGNRDVMTVHFMPGVQHMNGVQALQYARVRHDGTDFTRAKRQQQVILAIRNRVLDKNLLTGMTPTKLLDILRTFGNTVKTDMPVEDGIFLGQIAHDIPPESIHRLVIDENMTEYYVTEQGAQVLRPKWDLIRAGLKPIFSDSAPVAAATPYPSTVPGETTWEGVHIEVRNGTPQVGLDQRVASSLQDLGYTANAVGYADRQDYAQTSIIVYGDKLYTARRLAQVLNVQVEDLHHFPAQTDKPDQPDIILIVGQNALQTSLLQ